MKKSSAVVCVLVLFLVLVTLGLAACGGEGSGPVDSSTDTTASGSTVTTALGTGEKIFSLTELAEFDGKDGGAAYVAVDGVVYDVSDSARWPEGQHSSCNLGAMAGKDLSEEIEQAPASMRALLEKMRVVGKLEQ